MKQQVLIYIFGFILLQLFNSCDNIVSKKENCKNENQDDKNVPNICEEYSTPIDIVDRNDTLKIIVQCSDCGEWGGNKEYMYFQRNDNNQICARFILDTVPCDKIVEKDGFGVLDDRLRKIIVDTTKILNFEEEKLISQMLQRILELYLKNELHSNSGSYFQIENTDGTLRINYWNSGDCLDTYYFKTRRQIFGDY